MSLRHRKPWMRMAAAAVLTVPVLLGLQFVRAAGAPGAALSTGLLASGQLGSVTAQGGAQAGGPTSGAAGAGAGAGMVIGMLYTKGDASVSWNGAHFPVNDGSYAYVGGEGIRVAPGGMGLLRLPDGSSVFLCPGSVASVDRAPGGGYRVSISQGSSRFAFRTGTDFTVDANGTRIRPASSRGGAGGFVEGEVKVKPGGGCIVCEMQRGIRVSASGGGESPDSPTPGRVMEVAPRPAGQPGTTISITPIPPAALAAAVGSSGTPGNAFLCRCEDLVRELEQAVAPQGVAETAPPAEPAAPVEPQAPDVAAPAAPVAEAPPELVPPVAPPDAPPVALAEPGPPNPFDPNVLPPPAAGEPVEPVVVVAPPAVPRSGSGGGGVASPS